MSIPNRPSSGIGPVLLAAFAGGMVGVVAAMTPAFDRPPPARTTALPFPHHIPKYPGGVSLRFAMVHDVIHERYARHGKAYYSERERLARTAINEAGPQHDGEIQPSPEYFALFDDLGVALDRLGNDDEAVSVLRTKLAKQEGQHLSGRDLYTSYANLGTFLIHGNFAAARAGDAEARKRLQEGLAFIRRSIEVNPEAHFGREAWQAVAVEFFLRAIDDPELLCQFDMIGNRLDSAEDPRRNHALTDREYWAEIWFGISQIPDYSNNRKQHAQLAEERVHITRVGAQLGWEKLDISNQKPAPFDEPVLGIVGMWRLGGGPNPHFALALGETMIRVGQRYIAWCAYERAIAMEQRFTSSDDIRRRLVSHCRERQALIEGQLSAEDVADLRLRFQAELAHGQRYQAEFQQYEADQIAAGVSLDDLHFYDAFRGDHPPIASAVGEADAFIVSYHPIGQQTLYQIRRFTAMILFGAGLFAFAVAWAQRNRRQAITTSLSPVPGP